VQHAAAAELLLGGGGVGLEDDIKEQGEVGHARPLPRRQLAAGHGPLKRLPLQLPQFTILPARIQSHLKLCAMPQPH
jgi:hypothetical protein